MNIERTLYKERAIIGYNAKDVSEQIHSLQNQHQKELGLLQQEILKEKEKNTILKAKLKEGKQPLPKNTIAEELNSILMDHFIQQTKEILEFKYELQEMDRKQVEKLEQKKQQLEMAQKRVQDAIQYLKTLSGQKIELKKELSK